MGKRMGKYVIEGGFILQLGTYVRVIRSYWNIFGEV